MPSPCRASTTGLLLLLLNCLCFAMYLVMMQHRLAARPYPFTLFAAASVTGTAVITAAAFREFGAVRPPPLWEAVEYCPPFVQGGLFVQGN